MSEEIKIETGIPIPSARDGVLATTFRKMSIGDSIVVPKPPGNIHSSASQVGIKVATRKVADQPGKMRVWRIK